MRLFVAVNLPTEERRAAYAAAAPLRSAGLPVTWVPEAGLHVTLKFLGEVEEPGHDAIGDALAAAVAPVKPFDLGLGGGGAFPDLERPSVLWFGIERHPALELLANDVERALARFGFTSELKPFQPHLTIGRVRRDAPPEALAGAAEVVRGIDYQSIMPVESVDLMESTPGADGSVYRLVHRAVLGAGR